jgi:hypothetical protein
MKKIVFFLMLCACPVLAQNKTIMADAYSYVSLPTNFWAAATNDVRFIAAVTNTQKSGDVWVYLSGDVIDMSLRSQITNTSQPITFVGLSNLRAGIDMSAVIRINASQDVLVTIPDSWKNPDATYSFWVTNGWQAILSVDAIVSETTNCVWVLQK